MNNNTYREAVLNQAGFDLYIARKISTFVENQIKFDKEDATNSLFEHLKQNQIKVIL